MSALIAAFCGLLWGSCANVLLTRLPRGDSWLMGRSRCPVCGRVISWFDNIPLVSYFWLRGRCRQCGAPIPWRYPVVEAAHGLLFLALWLRFGGEPERLLFYGPAAAALLLLALFDLEHWWLPDVVLGLTAAWGIGVILLVELPLLATAVWGAVLGAGFLLAVRWAYYRLTGRIGLGWGDVKLLALLGVYTGPGALPWLLLASAVLALGGSPFWLKTQRQGRLTRIPYGFFLSLTGLIYLLAADWLATLELAGLEPLL